MSTGGETLLYFAYGSNMCLARMRERTPSARPLGPAVLPGRELRLHIRFLRSLECVRDSLQSRHEQNLRLARIAPDELQL